MLAKRIPGGPRSFFVVLLLVIALAGCGKQPKRLPVFPVKGKVSYAGRAPVGAQIVLHPLDAAESHLPRPIGVVGKDGSFELRTYENGDGAPAGKYKVTIQLLQFVKQGDDYQVGRNLLPERYRDPRKTNLQIEVAARPDNQLPPLILR